MYMNELEFCIDKWRKTGDIRYLEAIDYSLAFERIIYPDIDVPADIKLALELEGFIGMSNRDSVQAIKTKV